MIQWNCFTFASYDHGIQLVPQNIPKPFIRSQSPSGISSSEHSCHSTSGIQRFLEKPFKGNLWSVLSHPHSPLKGNQANVANWIWENDGSIILIISHFQLAHLFQQEKGRMDAKHSKNILSRPTLSNNSLCSVNACIVENSEQLLIVKLEILCDQVTQVEGFICIVGRPLLHKPSTCPQSPENRSPCRGGTQQYI